MTNLTAASPRTFTSPTLSMPESVHDAGGAVFEGAALQFNASDGDLENVTGAGTSFCGFGDETAEAEGDRVKVKEAGKVKLTVAKATNFDGSEKGDIVYASDGNTFTLVSTSNQAIGRLVEVGATGSTSSDCVVAFKGRQLFDQA